MFMHLSLSDPSSPSPLSPTTTATSRSEGDMSFRREEPAGYRPRQRVVLCTAGSEESNPIAEALTKERRTCKSFNGEIVWPPRVEAALVEALEAYFPIALDNCSTRANLFPERNKFVANYIREKTNHERTARQVGSRIQMLRGKWRSTELFKLVALPRELDGTASTGGFDVGELSSKLRKGSSSSLPSISRTSRYHPISMSGSSSDHTYSPQSTSPTTAACSPTYDDPFAQPDCSPTTYPHANPEMMIWTGVRGLRPIESPPEDSLNLPVKEHQLRDHDPDRGEFIATPPHIVPSMGGAPVATTPSSGYSPQAQLYSLLVEVPVPKDTPSQPLSPFSPPDPTPPFWPTTNFTSAIPLDEWSISKIYYDNAYQGQEFTRIQLMSTSPASPDLAGNSAGKEVGNYVTELVPRSWARMLSSGRDIRRYVVYQEIFPKSTTSPTSPTGGAEPETAPVSTPTYVMMYRFEVQQPAPQLPPLDQEFEYANEYELPPMESHTKLPHLGDSPSTGHSFHQFPPPLPPSAAELVPSLPPLDLPPPRTPASPGPMHWAGAGDASPWLHHTQAPPPHDVKPEHDEEHDSRRGRLTVKTEREALSTPIMGSLTRPTSSTGYHQQHHNPASVPHTPVNTLGPLTSPSSSQAYSMNTGFRLPPPTMTTAWSRPRSLSPGPGSPLRYSITSAS